MNELPYEPDVHVENAASHGEETLTSVMIPRAFENPAGWALIVDCEGDLVAIVPADKAEAMKKVFNQAYEEAYVVASRCT